MKVFFDNYETKDEPLKDYSTFDCRPKEEVGQKAGWATGKKWSPKKLRTVKR